MKQLIAKATAFCFDCVICLDESPATSSKASFKEAFIVVNNKVTGTRTKSAILLAGGFMHF